MKFRHIVTIHLNAEAEVHGSKINCTLDLPREEKINVFSLKEMVKQKFPTIDGRISLNHGTLYNLSTIYDGEGNVIDEKSFNQKEINLVGLNEINIPRTILIYAGTDQEINLEKNYEHERL